MLSFRAQGLARGTADIDDGATATAWRRRRV